MMQMLRSCGQLFTYSGPELLKYQPFTVIIFFVVHAGLGYFRHATGKRWWVALSPRQRGGAFLAFFSL